MARDAEGRLVPPEEALKRTTYFCPSCGCTVDLHAGERKRRHYHHRASTCSQESVLHVSAKRLIVQAIEAWHSGGRSPVFVRRCATAGCETATRQPIPKKVVRAIEELHLPTGHVADVGLLGPADLPIAAIEVLVSHEVDSRKAFEIGLPWVEVDAERVCASGGLVLEPTQDRFVPWLCAAHVSLRGEAKREERAHRELRARLLRALPYRLEDYPGYRADELVRCPNGHDSLRFEWSDREPPWPRPPHVVAHANTEDVVYDATRGRLRSVMAFRRTWVSACIRCGVHLASPSADRASRESL